MLYLYTTRLVNTTNAKLYYFVIKIDSRAIYVRLTATELIIMKKANVYNYIKVAEYSAKVQTIGNLQE